MSFSERSPLTPDRFSGPICWEHALAGTRSPAWHHQDHARPVAAAATRCYDAFLKLLLTIIQGAHGKICLDATVIPCLGGSHESSEFRVDRDRSLCSRRCSRQGPFPSLVNPKASR
jgi:hypothetical protein